MSSKVDNFSFNFADLASRLERTVERLPMAKEKPTTPTIKSMMANIYSAGVATRISP
jgi:hypothetical protein